MFAGKGAIMGHFEVVGKVKSFSKIKKPCPRKTCILHMISDYYTLSWEKHNNGTF